MRSMVRMSFWFLWIGTTLGFSQNTTPIVKELTVYFESASSVISKAETQKIEEAVLSLTDAHQYSIELSAHTDSDGNDNYNDNLSAQRALAVADLLVHKGFFNRKISFVAKGESQPIAANESDSGKAQNRRVTVKIQKKLDDTLSVGGFAIAEKVVTFSASEPQKVDYPSGTIIDIPENAFVDKDGNRVVGEVKLSYIEYRDPVDFILGNIPMDHQQDGENFVFNSGGMFKIRATHQGEEVFLDKDKNINLDFPLTEDLPDLNFYVFDETTNKWVEKERNITAKVEQKGVVDIVQFIQIQPAGIDSVVNDNRLTALQNSCYQISQHLKMGKLFASSTDSLYQKINFTERELEPYNLKKKKTVQYQISEAKRMKRTHLNHQKSYEVKCKLSTNDDHSIQFVSKTNSYLGKLNGIRWIPKQATEKYNSKSVALIGIKKLNENLYTISITDSLGEKQLDSVQVADFDEQKRLIVTNLSNQINNRQIQFKKRENFAKKQDFVIVKKSKELSRIKNIRYTTKDSIRRINQLVYSFWEFNKEFMTGDEKKLSRDEWVDYFDENKEVMLSRYNQIEDKKVKDCLDRIKVLERAQKNIGMINNSVNAVRQQLSISSLGIFNCDQIRRLVEPLIVHAEYSDENQNKITPIFIYIIDDTINGILRYDGYNGYSPSRFAYSPSSGTTLVAFDAEGDAYIYSRGKMEVLDTSKSNHHFVLQKINSVSNKEELTALLN